jgi:hypothetical protein
VQMTGEEKREASGQEAKHTRGAGTRARAVGGDGTSGADEVEEAEELAGSLAGGGHGGGEIAGVWVGEKCRLPGAHWAAFTGSGLWAAWSRGRRTCGL